VGSESERKVTPVWVSRLVALFFGFSTLLFLVPVVVGLGLTVELLFPPSKYNELADIFVIAALILSIVLAILIGRKLYKYVRKRRRIIGYVWLGSTTVGLTVVILLFLSLTILGRFDGPDPGLPTLPPISKLPLFPWPPPRASAMNVIPSELLLVKAGSSGTLGEVDSTLNQALKQVGHFEKSYYAVPLGYALVTRIERINSDGTPREGSERWEIDIGPLRHFSISAYLEALFTAPPGYFRIIVFVVTPYSFGQSDASVSREEAMDWLHEGWNRLPENVRSLLFTSDYACTALVYEFEQHGRDQAPRLNTPGQIPGHTHLVGLGLWDILWH
jgi:hypothetical protein